MIYIEEPGSPTDQLMRKLLGADAVRDAAARITGRNPMALLKRDLEAPVALLRQLDDPNAAYAVCLVCDIK